MRSLASCTPASSKRRASTVAWSWRRGVQDADWNWRDPKARSKLSASKRRREWMRTSPNRSNRPRWLPVTQKTTQSANYAAQVKVNNASCSCSQSLTMCIRCRAAPKLLKERWPSSASLSKKIKPSERASKWNATLLYKNLVYSNKIFSPISTR